MAQARIVAAAFPQIILTYAWLTLSLKFLLPSQVILFRPARKSKTYLLSYVWSSYVDCARHGKIELIKYLTPLFCRKLSNLAGLLPTYKSNIKC